MGVTYEPVDAGDAAAVVELLCGSEWPFHASPQLSIAEAEAVDVVGTDVKSFWIRDDGEVVGLVRLLDLDDVESGSPVFDLRIAGHHRGRGHGTAVVRWLSDHLFGEFAVLHRIEATTRSDNAAMIAVLERCGYHREGRLREAWLSRDGSRHDTLVYGLLRTDAR